eukprot:363534-Chlamydomonas_euryale.AAC.2
MDALAPGLCRVGGRGVDVLTFALRLVGGQGVEGRYDRWPFYTSYSVCSSSARLVVVEEASAEESEHGP